MGADRGILVEADDNKLDSLVVARALKALVEKEKPDLVLLGKQAVDGDSNATGQILAELLGWPMATFAMSIATSGRRQEPDGRSRSRHRRAHRQGADARPSSRVDLRIVAPKAVQNGVTPATHEYADGARYASLKGIMQAKKKPIAEQTLAGLGVDATPGTNYLEVRAAARAQGRCGRRERRRAGRQAQERSQGHLSPTTRTRRRLS